LDVTPASAPPDDFSQTPIPSAANVTYVQRVDNIHTNGWHLFSVEYYDGSVWGMWLLLTEDDGGTWTWISVAEAAESVITDGTYYYPVNFMGVSEETPPGNWDISSTSGSSATGLPDGNLGTFIATGTKAPYGFGMGYIDLDFGGQMTTDAAGSLEVRGKEPSGVPTELWNTYSHAVWISTNNVLYTQIFPVPNSTWESWTGVNSWQALRTIGAQTFRYLRLAAAPLWHPDADPRSFGIDTVRIGNVTSVISGGGSFSQMRPIWMDVDSESGEYVYLTLWGDDFLYWWCLKVSELVGLSTVNITENLGGCTIAQLNANTYRVYTHTPAFNQDICYLFGRWADPGLGTVHLVKYDLNLATPAVAVQTIIENGFGADYISAFRAEGTSDGSRQFYAIRSGAGVAKLYQGLETLTYRIDTSFAAGVAVYVDALTVTPDGTVAVGADTAAANMIEIIATPWASWTDITDSYPATGSVSSLTYL